MLTGRVHHQRVVELAGGLREFGVGGEQGDGQPRGLVAVAEVEEGELEGIRDAHQ